MVRVLKTIEEKVLEGNGITWDEALNLSKLKGDDIKALLDLANRVREKNAGNRIDLCSIMAAKVGRCSENCKFCSQSAHHSCNINVYDLISDADVSKRIEEIENSGAHRFCLVTSGEKLTDKEFERILKIYDLLNRKTDLSLCASLGALDANRAYALKQAGVKMYHHNVETSRSYFSKICTTHTYDDRINTIKAAKKADLKICCGGIISMGESMVNRLEMAFEIKELDVDSIPINILTPIKGTPLQDIKLLSHDEILKSIALFRLIMPHKVIRLAGGKENGLGEDEKKAYIGGINGALVGNYLTTSRRRVEDGLNMFRQIGYEIN